MNQISDDSQINNLSDREIPRDLHTGNIIHNHYHSPSAPVPAPAPQTAVPPTVIYQQTPPLAAPSIPMYGYKEIGADYWIFNSTVCGLCSAFIPVVTFVTGFFSLVGFVILLRNLNIGQLEPGHPDSERVGPALLVNIVSLLCIPFGMLYGWTVFF
ncbi:MAG: hypothetical protein QMC58_02020 [Candidatus Poseidoniaceae archaeon]